MGWQGCKKKAFVFMAWKFNWWSCSAQKVANSEVSRCLRHLKCRSTSSFSPPRQILKYFWLCWENLLPKKIRPRTLKYFSSSSFSFSLAPCSCFCFHLNILFCFLCQDQLVALGDKSTTREKRKRTEASCSTFGRAQPSRRTRRSTRRLSLPPGFV